MNDTIPSASASNQSPEETRPEQSASVLNSDLASSEIINSDATGYAPHALSNEEMSVAEFEQRLPEFFSTGTGKVSDDPRFQAFLLAHPASAALVRDLEYIAEQARALFEPANDAEPSDAVWSNIQSQLNQSTDPETSGSPELPGNARH